MLVVHWKQSPLRAMRYIVSYCFSEQHYSPICKLSKLPSAKANGMAVVGT